MRKYLSIVVVVARQGKIQTYVDVTRLKGKEEKAIVAEIDDRVSWFVDFNCKLPPCYILSVSHAIHGSIF